MIVRTETVSYIPATTLLTNGAKSSLCFQEDKSPLTYPPMKRKRKRHPGFANKSTN